MLVQMQNNVQPCKVTVSKWTGASGGKWAGDGWKSSTVEPDVSLANSCSPCLLYLLFVQKPARRLETFWHLNMCNSCRNRYHCKSKRKGCHSCCRQMVQC